MKPTYPYLVSFFCLLFMCTAIIPGQTQSIDTTGSHARRQAYLQQILRWIPDERPGYGRVSYLDSTFGDWLERTGELPPDFSLMPSIHRLPDPLILDEGGENIPIITKAQWEQKKDIMREQLQHYVTGTFPPAPTNMESTILNERMDGAVKVQMVELRFGPDHQAKLTIELMIPPGDGPFPVFMTQWNHRGWARIAVRRGYIGCVYAGADTKDDTEDYSRIWAGQYDFTRLMRRAWGSYRAIDYLYTMPSVDRDKIALTGHSRNGKQSLIAAAFDERITAIIPSSGGTGAEVPWRYCAYQYDVEDIALLGPAQPSWLHPRLRFFIGREQKLPIDQNSFMALIAPRGLMLSTAFEESASNPWGIEKAYLSAQKVYEYLSAKDHLALRYRNGTHGTTAEDIEAYIDFFDFVFGRRPTYPHPNFNYVPSFDQWKERSGELIDPLDYPFHQTDTDLKDQAGSKITTTSQWQHYKESILDNVDWMLGDQPPGVTNPGPGTLNSSIPGEEKFGSVLRRPAANEFTGRQAVSPYNGFGDYLFGYLYYPREKVDQKEKLPVVIYLHEYDYSKGFSSMSLNHSIHHYIEGLVRKGFAVFAYDMIGFGNRQEEGLHFYNRYPHWSKMGKMVTDVRGAVDALSNMDVIDPDQIYVTGYSLGGTVGLYATAMDERITGVVSISGFTPMRSGDLNELHIDDLSRQHLLMPRLGFFQEAPERIPYDYGDLLAAIAPRPVLVIAPQHDQAADVKSVKASVRKANQAYHLWGDDQYIDLVTPDDYNRFSDEMRKNVIQWLEGRQ